MDRKIYIKVLLPLRLEWEPCYWSDRELPPGRRVEVEFAGRTYTGVVWERLGEPEMDPERIRGISGYETGLEDILEEEMALWKWIAGYYLCTPGEVYKSAYPAMKLKGEQVSANARERAERLNRAALAVKKERLGKTLARLAQKEEALGRHRPGTKVSAALEESILKLTRERDSLTACIAEAEARNEETPRTHGLLPPPSPVVTKPVLLTGPGRQDGYIERIAEEMRHSRTTLLLVPEIERSFHLQDALEEAFGEERVLVFHSALAAGRRRSVAAKLRSSGPFVVLGTRSALFLPLTRLGLVIVDEEQDPSYKQTDTAPRFNGRDTAVALASDVGANVILGSSFPSLETLLNCRTGKYVQETVDRLPEVGVEVIDTACERRKRGMDGPLSFRLIKEIDLVTGSGGGVVILASGWALDEVREKTEALFPGRSGITVENLYTSKWLDIPGTKLLAVLSPDSMLSRQDIRADERTLQMMEMFRAKTDGGKFIVQTARSAHPVFSFGDGRAERLLAERKDFGLPPYTRLVDVFLKDSNESRKALMEKELGKALRGPWKRMQLPDRLRLVLPKDRNLGPAKESLRSIIAAFEKEKKYTGHIHIDVDPT